MRLGKILGQDVERPQHLQLFNNQVAVPLIAIGVLGVVEVVEKANREGVLARFEAKFPVVVGGLPSLGDHLGDREVFAIELERHLGPLVPRLLGPRLGPQPVVAHHLGFEFERSF